MSPSSAHAKRRRHLRPGPGPDRPGPEDGLVRGVLVEVDEHPPAPLLLPPGRRHQIGPAPLQLAGHRHGRGPDLDRGPSRQEPDVHVDAPVAGRLGPARSGRRPASSRSTSWAASRTISKSTPGVGSRSMRSSSACSGSSASVGPHVKAQAGQVDRPQHVRQVGGDQRLRGGAVGGGHDRRLQPVRPLLRDSLLEKGRPLGAMREPLQQDRPAAHGRHQGWLDRQVVPGQVQLGAARLAEEHLLPGG